MSIHHIDVGDDIAKDEAFIFASLGGFTCSVCAPGSWTKEDVEGAICRDLREDGWQAIDKSELFGFGSPTPNPCGQDENRKHWFMWRTR